MGSLEPNDREMAAYWMPFTHNRYFKQNHARRMLAKAEGAYYWSTEGEKLFDALSGLWCSGLGHRHPKIVEAVKQQLDTVDYSPAFQMGYGPAFKLAERIVGMSPAGMGQVFFVNSGSEAVDTSMKMALAYHRAKGEASRTRFIGREKGYHGVGFVEPMQGSAGVIVPPKGYLQRLREICTKNGILLIFDEVICGFGRMGTNFGAQHYGVVPDMITFAKGVNNGTVPMGGVIVRKELHDALMTGPDHAVEFFHGYTYSGHPLAVAAAHATLDILAAEGVNERVKSLVPVLEDAVHALKGEPNVIDIRNCQLAAAVELSPIEGKPGLRALKVFEESLKRGVLFRFTGDIIAMGPPFISTPDELRRMIEVLREAIRATA